MAIGTKQGITYHCECKRMSDIINPKIDNSTNMRYTGFFDEMWDEYDVDFDTFGFGLKKTRQNKGLIICDDASKCFGTTKGYVGMVLELPKAIRNGVYFPLSGDSTDISEYLLWGVNLGNIEASFPTIYAKLTADGIEFTIWTIYGKYTIEDTVSNISANYSTFYEFIWNTTPMDDFSLTDFDATMAIRVNGVDTVIGNYPIGSMTLSNLNFCVLDSPKNYYNIEGILRKLTLSNEIPISVEHDWQSSSSSSGGEAGSYYYSDLTYANIVLESTITSVDYTNIDTVANYLQLTPTSRRFNHMWLVNSSGGNTVSKIDITDATHPVETGRYRLASSADSPSRTVVVPPGDCWVASQIYGTVTKIGLIEASHCRNTCLTTSTGTSEYTYGNDDAVLYYFDAKSETMRYPSTAPAAGRTIKGLTDDVNGNIWVESGEEVGTWFKIVGDGGLTTGSVTKYSSLLTTGSWGAVCSYTNNYIWSVKAPSLSGIEYFDADNPTDNGSFNSIQTYGIAYSRGYIYTGDYVSSPSSTTRRVARTNVNVVNSPIDYPLYTTTFTFTNCPTISYFPRQFTVITNNDSTEDLYILWYGIGTSGYLSIMRNHKQYADGINIDVDFNACEKYVLYNLYPNAIGVTYNSANKPFVWVVSSSGTNVQAFDPSINQMVQFFDGNNYTPVGKSLHLNYTNFTGTLNETSVEPVTGTAIYVFDGASNNRLWYEICLTTSVPSGSLTIYGSASNDSDSFAQAVEITNCTDITSLNLTGRYLRLILQFTRTSQSDPSPTVRDIEVKFTS